MRLHVHFHHIRRLLCLKIPYSIYILHDKHNTSSKSDWILLKPVKLHLFHHEGTLLYLTHAVHQRTYVQISAHLGIRMSLFEYLVDMFRLSPVLWNPRRPLAPSEAFVRGQTAFLCLLVLTGIWSFRPSDLISDHVKIQLQPCCITHVLASSISTSTKCSVTWLFLLLVVPRKQKKKSEKFVAEHVAEYVLPLISPFIFHQIIIFSL